MEPSPSLLSGTWSAIVSAISRVLDLESTAREFKALQRVRKIRTAEALLRLALIWGPGGQSFRGTASSAQDGGIGALSDKAVEGRLRKMGDWLEHILASLLTARLSKTCPVTDGGLAVSLVDGSIICSPGKGQDWRLHARYDPARGRFADLVVTTTKQAETVTRTRIGSGRVLIMDRGYARVRDFKAILDDKSNFITRISWASVKLYNAEGQRLDIMGLLCGSTKPREVTVWVEGIKQALRLLIRPLPPEAAERQRQRRRRKANKKCQKVDPRTIEAAGFLMLLTSLPAETVTADAVADAYRQRWQIEIGFKRLKTLGDLDRLPCADPVLARTWLLAHMIVAVLTDDLANEIIAPPPETETQPPSAKPAIQSIWRAWAAARTILLFAITPRPNLEDPQVLACFRQRLAEAPRKREIQACSLRVA